MQLGKLHAQLAAMEQPAAEVTGSSGVEPKQAKLDSNTIMSNNNKKSLNCVAKDRHIVYGTSSWPPHTIMFLNKFVSLLNLSARCGLPQSTGGPAHVQFLHLQQFSWSPSSWPGYTC